MDKQYWILINNELLGPYTALEIIDLNLLDSTPITDNLDNERWKTVGSIDFNVSEADEKKPEGENNRHDSHTLRMDGGCYQFYYKQNNTEHGPRTARQMLKLNLSVDTPVSESSLNGQWFVAGNFDFQSLSEDENDIKATSRRLANKNATTGAIWLIAGLVVTYISFNSNFFGGGIIAIGAIIWGFIRLVSGIFGDDGLTDEERKRIYEYEDTEASDDKEPHEDTDTTLSQEKQIELYAELGLSPDASDSEVRKAYRIMAKQYHPDRHGNLNGKDREELVARFRNITEAFELIKQIRNMK